MEDLPSLVVLVAGLISSLQEEISTIILSLAFFCFVLVRLKRQKSLSHCLVDLGRVLGYRCCFMGCGCLLDCLDGSQCLVVDAIC